MNKIKRIVLATVLAVTAAFAAPVAILPVSADTTCNGQMYIVVYEHAYFDGAQRTYCKYSNVYNASNWCLFKDPDFDFCHVSLNDSISSIKVGNAQTGWKIRFYRDSEYRGCYITVQYNHNNLTDAPCNTYAVNMNDRISSWEWIAVTS